MKYQVRITGFMSDKPASAVLDTYSEALEKLKEVREEIKNTWVSPDPDMAYICTLRRAK